jgi:hypothetical protein
MTYFEEVCAGEVCAGEEDNSEVEGIAELEDEIWAENGTTTGWVRVEYERGGDWVVGEVDATGATAGAVVVTVVGLVVGGGGDTGGGDTGGGDTGGAEEEWEGDTIGEGGTSETGILKPPGSTVWYLVPPNIISKRTDPWEYISCWHRKNTDIRKLLGWNIGTISRRQYYLGQGQTNNSLFPLALAAQPGDMSGCMVR